MLFRVDGYTLLVPLCNTTELYVMYEVCWSK